MKREERNEIETHGEMRIYDKNEKTEGTRG
jgi:hypothetical protein